MTPVSPCIVLDPHPMLLQSLPRIPLMSVRPGCCDLTGPLTQKKMCRSAFDLPERPRGQKSTSGAVYINVLLIKWDFAVHKTAMANANDEASGAWLADGRLIVSTTSWKLGLHHAVSNGTNTIPGSGAPE